MHWEDTEKNLGHFESIFTKLSPCDLVIIPEMFSTGFSMNCALADMQGMVLNWMKSMSKKYGFALTGSAMIGEQGKYYNRLFFVEPSGKFHSYDKKHLFRMAMEGQHYSAGEQRLIVDYCGWKICPLICYDLRFPGWSRNQPIGEKGTDPVYDLLIYVANWPEKRALAWQSLIGARAIENYSYCIGVNRIGEDGNQIPYRGNSVVIDPQGKRVAETPDFTEDFCYAELDLNYLHQFREQFPALKDADNLLLN